MCKPRCDESNTPTQAGCGVAQGSGNCTTCKVMKKNVIALHNERQGLARGENPRRPSQTGLKIGKPRKGAVF
ncbi:hypothetical protein KPSA3_00354 [Pseudomonas syringae pv. actinidiae]|uniref:Uncharacterized protein n=1 Tax=Pseudomonas syringae pv. actinidiae TaxID=103796 RepID=A0AAN4Q037_PSESF|nr:hypothetical protein KPSA3_00354 [Pseudomonas syringae pv. actinidiae]